jgi:hypothetical protein
MLDGGSTYGAGSISTSGAFDTLMNGKATFRYIVGSRDTLLFVRLASQDSTLSKVDETQAFGAFYLTDSISTGIPFVPLDFGAVYLSSDSPLGAVEMVASRGSFTMLEHGRARVRGSLSYEGDAKFTNDSGVVTVKHLWVKVILDAKPE